MNEGSVIDSWQPMEVEEVTPKAWFTLKQLQTLVPGLTDGRANTWKPYFRTKESKRNRAILWHENCVVPLRIMVMVYDALKPGNLNKVIEALEKLEKHETFYILVIEGVHVAIEREAIDGPFV